MMGEKDDEPPGIEFVRATIIFKFKTNEIFFKGLVIQCIIVYTLLKSDITLYKQESCNTS